MKWYFLITNSPFLNEFLGKLSHQVIKEGDDCILVTNGKIAEFSKKQYFPKEVKILSKIDWCIKNYKKDQKEFESLSWKKLFADFDRFKLFKFNYNNSVEMASQLYQFATFIFQKEKPDVVVCAIPGSLFGGIFYYFCQKYKVTYLGIMPSRLKGRTDIYDLEHTCSKYEKTFKELNNDNISDDEKKFARDFIKNFLSHQWLSPFMEHYIEYSKTHPLKDYLKREKKMVQLLFQYFLKRKYFKPFDYESEIEFKAKLRYPWKALKRKFKILLQKNIFDSLNDNDKFFLFPLQVQPEFSSSFLATYFSDLLNTIKNIAFSLPFPYKLYVKEHWAAVGERSGGFYKELKRIPNIFLISPNENVENLIKKSQGVITLTGTIGMEAALTGKPVYVLGNVFYSYHPSCRKINSFEELKQKIQADLIKKPVVEDLENINLRFVISYFKNTITGDNLQAADENDPNDYKVIYQDIRRIFLEGKTY